ncbi:MAG TPA: hypothetical protein VGP22_17940 [Albitalea sp.]|jgi:hypothetical protein|nr:hypothetical protein [Albitalea sp.]
MRSLLIVCLAVLPPLMAALWTWLQLHKTERQLGTLGNFEGMHLED